MFAFSPFHVMLPDRSRIRNSKTQGLYGTNEDVLLPSAKPPGNAVRDLAAYSQAQLDQVSLRLNQRPRKILGFDTPASKLQTSVASTI